MSGPLVSVVIPVHDSERYIAESIESALAQTYEPVEIIVVDDGSTDDSASVVETFGDRVALIRQSNAGPSAARNAGVAAGSGELIAFHDDDDLMTADKLDIQVAHLIANPGLGGVVGRQDLIIEEGAELPYWARGTANPIHPGPGAAPPPTAPRGVIDDPQVHTMSVVVRREAFAAAGGFDESLGHGEDIDFLLRIVDAGLEVEPVPDVVVRRRVHSGSLAQDPAAGREAMFQAVERHIERKRRNA